MARDNLRQRGRQYYLHLVIPRKLRRFFHSKSGKPMAAVWEPLGPNLDIAEPRAAQRVADYRAIFARLKTGEQMTPEQIKAALAIDTAAEMARLREEFERQMAYGRRLAREMLDEEERENPRPPYVPPTDPIEILKERVAREYLLAMGALPPRGPLPPTAPAAIIEPAQGETISAAAEHCFAEMTRDPTAAPRKATLDGHRQRVQALIAYCGDVPLTDITRAKASDFLDSLKLSNRTRNNYATTLALVFKSAKQRGRFQGDNPFEDQHRKAVGEKREKFTVGELQTVFDALPREIRPAKHTTESAVPWAALIAAYSGMRREEVCQLSVADIKTLPVNGGTLDCFLVHNGGENHLKNEPSERAVPIHSELVRHGLLDYVKALPKNGLLFPGLKRRASKDNKIGGRLGEIFNKKLRKLGLKEGRFLDFHSLRHTVIGTLQAAGKSEADVAAVVGHYKEGITFGVYGVSEKEIMEKGHPVLKERAGTVEAIAYEGLKLPAAK
jgi:integrase